MKRTKSVAKIRRADEKLHKKLHRLGKKEEKLHEREEKLHKRAERLDKKETKPKKAASSLKKKKIERVMKEFKEHKLHSGSKGGALVTDPKQAIAIGYAEAREAVAKRRKKKNK